MNATAASLPALLVERARNHPDQVATRTATAGYWREVGWRETLEETARVHDALGALGVAPTDVVVIATSARREWPLATCAVHALGATVLTVATDAPAEELESIVATHRCSLWLAEDEEQFDKARAAGVTEALPMVVIDPRGVDLDQPGVRSWTSLIDTTADVDAAVGRFEQATAALDPDGIASIVTTGSDRTGGAARFVTHRALCDGDGMPGASGTVLGAGDEYLSFLPPAWPLEQQAVLVDALSSGAVVSFGSRSGGVLAELADIQPTVVQGPAAFWDDLATDIRERMAAAPKPARSAFAKLTGGGRSGSGRGPSWFLFTRPLRKRIGLLRVVTARTSDAPDPDVTALFTALGVSLEGSVGSERGSDPATPVTTQEPSVS